MNKNNKENLPATMEPQDIFARFDQQDDALILKELENQVVDSWVYHFVVEGHHVWGLSKVGIDACTRRMGEKGVALREDYCNYDVDPTNPEYVLFTASVSKHVIGEQGAEATVESAIGTKRQWIMQRRRSDGKLVANKFWFEQGSIKALRNAKARLIPEDIKTKVISFAKSHKKVHEIDAPVSQKREESKSIPRKISDFGTTMKEAEETSKKLANAASPEFPDDKKKTNGLFPPDKEEKIEPEMPMQKEIMELTGIEATLVDKYGFTPDQIIEKLEEKFGASDLTKLTKEHTLEGIKYFKNAMLEIDKNK